MSNELTTTNGIFDLKETMDQVEPRLPQIKIIHQGQMFEMPDTKKVESFTGIILDVSRANAYWKESFDKSGGGTPPDCLSLDGIEASLCEDPQAEKCSKCDHNKYGSDGGKGKACKNMKRVHIISLNDEPTLMPYRLTLPPSNLKAIDEYISILAGKGSPYQLIKTEFKLKKAQNSDGIAYSMVALSAYDQISDRTEALKIKAMRDQWLSVMREQAIEGGEI